MDCKDGPPTIGPHGPSAAAMDDPPDHARLPHLVQRGPSTALSIITVCPPSHGRSPTAGPFNGVAASGAKYIVHNIVCALTMLNSGTHSQTR